MVGLVEVLVDIIVEATSRGAFVVGFERFGALGNRRLLLLHDQCLSAEEVLDRDRGQTIGVVLIKHN